MTRLAHIQDGRVANIILGAPGCLPDTVAIPDGTDCAIGWAYADGAFIDDGYRPGPDQLAVTLTPAVAPVGTPVHYSAEIRSASGALIAADLTYYVPVTGIDGRQCALLTADFIDGEAVGTVPALEPGIYTLDLSRIRPTPTAALSASPELIITEA